MVEFKDKNGMLEVWDVVKTFSEDESKIVHHCKDFIVPKNTDVFTCTCGRRVTVDHKGKTLKIE